MNAKSQAKASLKTTSIVGGGQVINILLGLVKTKVAALLLGPAGIGLIGLFTNAVDTVKTISGMGLSFSGVRDIAFAKKQNDIKLLIETLSVYIKWSIYLAIFGLILIVLGAVPLGYYIFKSVKYSFELRLLGIAVLFHILAATFSSALQGLGEISKMVRAGIYSNLLQTIVSVILYFFIGEKAIVPIIILGAIVNFSFSFFFFRTIKLPFGVWQSLIQSFPKAKSMIKIGLFTVIVAVFDQIVALYLKSYIAGESGISAVGIYTTVITVGGMYLSLVMSAVGTEYYPRLAAIQNDDLEINKALNIQVDILLILAIPIIVTMLIFSPFIIGLLYSKEFLAASSILQWYFVGDFFKIISWPCGYIILAKGLGKVYVWTSIAYTIISTSFIIFLYPRFDLQIVGISFATMQFLLLIYYYYYVYKQFNIKLSKVNVKQCILLSVTIIWIFFIVRGEINIYRKILLAVLYISIIVQSLIKLKKIIDFKSILKKLWK